MASRKFSGIRNSYVKLVSVCLDIADYCTIRIYDNSFAAVRNATQSETQPSS